MCFITGDAKDMKARLANETVSPLKYNAEKPKSLTDEDKVIESYKLAIDKANIEVMDVKDVFK
jgi:zinc protease